MEISNRCLSLSFLSVWFGFVTLMYNIFIQDWIEYVGQVRGYTERETTDLEALGIYSFIYDFSVLCVALIFFSGWALVMFRSRHKMANLGVLYLSIGIGICLIGLSFEFDARIMYCFYSPEHPREYYLAHGFWP